MTKNYITCNEAIRNGNEEALAAFRSFVAATARGKRRDRIFYSRLVPREFGILSRLWYYPENGKVFYCCGQSWNDEMAVLRDIFEGK